METLTVLELWIEIFQHLNPSELYPAMQVSKQWYTRANYPSLWHYYYQKDFGPHSSEQGQAPSTKTGIEWKAEYCAKLSSTLIVQMKFGIPGGDKGWKLKNTKLDITCGHGVPEHRIPIPIPTQYDSAFYFYFILNEPEKVAEIESLLRFIGLCALCDGYDYEESLADKVDELAKQLVGKIDFKVDGNALYMAYFYNVIDIKAEYNPAPRNCIDYFLKKEDTSMVDS